LAIAGAKHRLLAAFKLAGGLESTFIGFVLVSFRRSHGRSATSSPSTPLARTSRTCSR
jgi:hypothetical protein